MELSELHYSGIVNSVNAMELIVSATDHGIVPRSSDSQVVITIEHSDTNIPEFIASSYQVAITVQDYLFYNILNFTGHIVVEATPN